MRYISMRAAVKVSEDIAQVREADAEVRLVLPSAAVMALQFGPGQWFDDKSETHG